MGNLRNYIIQVTIKDHHNAHCITFFIVASHYKLRCAPQHLSVLKSHLTRGTRYQDKQNHK